MERAAIFTVIFPGNLPFFNDYLDSLCNQTEKHFDLILLTDSVGDIESWLRPYRDRVSIQIYPVSGTIASVREVGVEILRKLQHPYVIFSDTDDIFSNDRVAKCCEHLASFPVVVNDLSPFSHAEDRSGVGYWDKRLEDGHIFSVTDIERYNFVGLGNTSVRREVLEEFKIPQQLKAIDWFLFYRWLQEREGVFTKTGKMFYRQHVNNQVGLHRINEQRLRAILITKIEHYKNLSSLFPHLYSLMEETERKLNRINSDKAFLERKLQDINNNTINYFWWEETEYIHE
ncbi:MAG TPA: hypothetical protein VIN08_26445 [Ohtaekwangia sp.]|uniref:hypothetical protein n=1 Tax=Ohtaekwangia sp. TaxID=2066019 RepID=UPI002F946368